MEKKFEEIAVGTKFRINGMEYVKTEEVRVSCCRSINCHVAADVNQKVFFPGSTAVVVDG
jgi:hypothetical protein